MFVIYEQFLCLLWNSMFYTILKQANYDEEEFNKKLDSFVDLSKLDELTDEGGKSMETSELIDITVEGILKLGEELTIPYPLNYFIFTKLSRNLFTSDSLKEGKVMNEVELKAISNNLYSFMNDILNIKPPFDYAIWMNLIWENFLVNEKNFKNDKNEVNFAWLSLSSILLKKVGSHKTKVLQCRLISIDLLHVYKVPLEKFDFSKPNMAKLLNRMENSSVLLPTIRITKELLKDYKNVFANNTTVMKLIINLYKC